MIAILASLMLAASPALAQDVKRPELQVKVSQFDLKTQGLTFPSGLQVIMQKDSGATAIHVATVHSGGTLKDTEGKHGTGHIAVHATYSARLGEGTVRDALYAAGADYNAYIGPDWLIYQTSAPKSALPTILAVEGLRITDTFQGFTDADLAREKTIYSLEPYYRELNQMTPAYRTFSSLTFDETQPFSQLGTHLDQEELMAVTQTDIDEYAKDTYIPSETTLVISGNIDFDETISDIFKNMPPRSLHPDATEEHLQQFFKPDVVNPDPDNPDHVTKWLADPETGDLIDLTWEPPNRITWDGEVEPFDVNKSYEKGDVVHVKGQVDTPKAFVAWGVPGTWIGYDAYTAIGANAVAWAGGNDWGQQFSIKKDSRGGAMAGCTHVPSGAASWIVCEATARDEKVNADELTDRLKAASAVFADPNQTMLHIQTAEGGRRAALGSMLHSLENHASITGGIVPRTALNAHFLGDPGYNTVRMNEMMQLDQNTVQPWVRDWLPEARSVSVVIDPIPRERWLQLSTPVTFHGSVFGHTIPDVEEPPTDEDIAEAYPDFDMSKVKTKTLSNGLKVVVVPFGNVPIVSAAVAYRGGSAYEEGLDSYVSGTMRGLLNEVWEDTTGRKQDLLPRNIGAQSLTSSQAEISFEGYATPAKNLDGALYLTRRGQMARKVQLAARPNWWKAMRQSLPLTWDQASVWALQDRMANILPDHPLTWFIGQDKAIELKDMSVPELVAYQNRKYHVKNATLVIVGAIDADQAFADAEGTWGSWSSSGEPIAHPAEAKPANPGKVLLYDKSGADQTTVAAVCRLPATTPETAAHQEVLASITDEALLTELADAGAHPLASSARVTHGMGVGYMDFAAIVPHDQVVQAVAGIRATIARADEGTHDTGRVQQHKLRIAGSKVLNYETTRSTLDMVAKDQVLPWRGPDFQEAFGKALVATDAEALKSAAAGCADSLTITIETPASGFDALKSELGAEAVDWLAKADAEFERWDKGAYKKRLKARAKAKAK